jgi:hypothetical protein
MSDGDFNDKGVAQAKDKLNGKAQPSSQRAAKAFRKDLAKKPRSC